MGHELLASCLCGTHLLAKARSLTMGTGFGSPKDPQKMWSKTHCGYMSAPTSKPTPNNQIWKWGHWMIANICLIISLRYLSFSKTGKMINHFGANEGHSSFSKSWEPGTVSNFGNHVDEKLFVSRRSLAVVMTWLRCAPWQIHGGWMWHDLLGVKKNCDFLRRQNLLSTSHPQMFWRFLTGVPDQILDTLATIPMKSYCKGNISLNFISTEGPCEPNNQL